MFRNLVAAAVAVVVFAGGLSAAEIKGKLVKVDAEKGTITVSVGKKGEATDKTYNIAKDAKFCTLKAPAVKGDKPTEEAFTDGLKNEMFTKIGQKGGPSTATLVTEGEGDKEVVKEVKIAAGKSK